MNINIKPRDDARSPREGFWGYGVTSGFSVGSGTLLAILGCCLAVGCGRGPQPPARIDEGRDKRYFGVDEPGRPSLEALQGRLEERFPIGLSRAETENTLAEMGLGSEPSTSCEWDGKEQRLLCTIWPLDSGEASQEQRLGLLFVFEKGQLDSRKVRTYVVFF